MTNTSLDQLVAMLSNPVLPDWITAIATVIITSASIIFGKRQLDELNREKESKKIKEFLQKIISPLISQLDSEIRYLEKNRFSYAHISRKMLEIHKLDINSEDKEVLRDFRKRFPIVVDDFVKRDEVYGKLEEELQKLGNLIGTQEFETKCQELINEWNGNNPHNRIPAGEWKFIIGYIIDNLPELDNSYGTFSFFWSRYSKELLQIRDEGGIKTQIMSVGTVNKNFLQLSVKIKDELIKLKDNFKDTYKLTEEETK